MTNDFSQADEERMNRRIDGHDEDIKEIRDQAAEERASRIMHEAVCGERYGHIIAGQQETRDMIRGTILWLVIALVVTTGFAMLGAQGGFSSLTTLVLHGFR